VTEKNRLLTPKRLTTIIRQYSIKSEADVIQLSLQIRNEQDAQTARMVAEEIFGEIENSTVLSASVRDDMLERRHKDWQALKSRWRDKVS